MSRIGNLLRHVGGRGVFPAEFAWFLEGPWRRWVLSPATLRARLPLSSASTVCEIGVGGGYYARAFAPLVRRYLGIDLQSAMLRRLRSFGSPVQAVQADATALPLAAASVDIVVAVTVLGEIPLPVAGVAEVARILKPGGTLSVSEHVPDPDYVSFRRLQDLCASAGLELVSRHGPVWSYTANFRKPTRFN